MSIAGDCTMNKIEKDIRENKAFLQLNEEDREAILKYCSECPSAAELYSRETKRSAGKEGGEYMQAMNRFFSFFVPNARNWRRMHERSFIDDLFFQAASHPERTAVVDENGTRFTTYAEFTSLIRKTAGKLREMHLTPGSFIVINMGRCREYLTAFYAVIYAGYAVIPLVPEIPAERERYIIDESKSELTIHRDFFSGIEQYEEYDAPARREDDNALMLYTSGSTGRPKGVYFHFGPLSRLYQNAIVLLDGIDPIIYGSSIAYSFAAISVDTFHVFCAGGTMHILPDEVRKDVFAMNAYYRKHQLTTGNVHPRLHKMFDPGPQLRRIFTSGHRITEFWSDQFETILGYGLAETFSVATYFVLDKSYAATPVGKQMGGFRVTVCDKDGREVPDGTQGEVRIAGDLAEGYFNMPELTAETFEKQPDGTVLLHTHDIGYKDENGDLVLVNRDDWMVKINGMSVNPAEIDYAMSQIPGISETAAKGFTDRLGSSYLCSFYATDDPAYEPDPEYLKKELSRTLMDYMIPSVFVKMDHLPQTVSSKVDYTKLMPPADPVVSSEYEEPADDLERAVCEAFAKVLKLEKVGRNDDFFRLGGDSLSVMETVAELNHDSVSVGMIVQEKTPARIAEQIRQIQSDADKAPKEACTLTPYQKRYLKFCTMAGNITMGNSPVLWEFDLSFCTPLQLKEAVAEVMNAHPSFRTILHRNKDGKVIQTFDGSILPPEITSVPREQIEELTDSLHKPFTLFESPLYRTQIIDTGHKLFLYLDIHHIITDAVSQQNILRDILSALQGKPLPADPYRNWLSRIDERDHNGEITALEKQLTDSFGNGKYTVRPEFDHTDPSFHTSTLRYTAVIDPQYLKKRSDGHSAGIQTALISCALKALHKDTGRDRVMVNWLYSGRDTSAKQNMTGLLISAMPAAADFSLVSNVPELFTAVDTFNEQYLIEAELSPGTLLSGPFEKDIMTVNYTMFTSDKDDAHVRRHNLINRNTANTNIFYIIVNEHEDHSAEILFKYNDTLYSESHIREFARFFFEAAAECAEKESWLKITG